MDAPSFRLGGQQLDERMPLLMGVVNATSDSFSDAGRFPTLASRVDHALALLDEGADLLDVGGQSAITGVGETAPDDEIGAVVPLIEAILHQDPSVLISVDTYKPSVASAALRAGAMLINDTSGLRNLDVADVAAAYGAGLVITHNLAPPKERLTDPLLYDDVVQQVAGFLLDRAAAAIERGVDRESLIFDPGPDFSKTPHQTVEVLRNIDVIDRLGRPVLLAVSRKDFIGAITGRPPRGRLAGTLAAVGHLDASDHHIFRVHDVGAVRDFLAVSRVLQRRRHISTELSLPVHLRREPEVGA